MSDQTRSGTSRIDPLERGSFHDDYRSYKVRASSADAPDSFQVLTGQGDDIVLIVSGLNSGDLKATWGPFWRSFKPQWKVWVEDSAFRVFYSGRTALTTTPPMVKFCDG
jgi:hypothetical protein